MASDYLRSHSNRSPKRNRRDRFVDTPFVKDIVLEPESERLDEIEGLRLRSVNYMTLKTVIAPPPLLSESA